MLNLLAGIAGRFPALPLQTSQKMTLGLGRRDKLDLEFAFALLLLQNVSSHAAHDVRGGTEREIATSRTIRNNRN